MVPRSKTAFFFIFWRNVNCTAGIVITVLGVMASLKAEAIHRDKWHYAKKNRWTERQHLSLSPDCSRWAILKWTVQFYALI